VGPVNAYQDSTDVIMKVTVLITVMKRIAPALGRTMALNVMMESAYFSNFSVMENPTALTEVTKGIADQ